MYHMCVRLVRHMVMLANAHATYARKQARGKLHPALGTLNKALVICMAVDKSRKGARSKARNTVRGDDGDGASRPAVPSGSDKRSPQAAKHRHASFGHSAHGGGHEDSWGESNSEGLGLFDVQLLTARIQLMAGEIFERLRNNEASVRYAQQAAAELLRHCSLPADCAVPAEQAIGGRAPCHHCCRAAEAPIPQTPTNMFHVHVTYSNAAATEDANN